jgi:hypothetical protein
MSRQARAAWRSAAAGARPYQRHCRAAIKPSCAESLHMLVSYLNFADLALWTAAMCHCKRAQEATDLQIAVIVVP